MTIDNYTYVLFVLSPSACLVIGALIGAKLENMRLNRRNKK